MTLVNSNQIFRYVVSCSGWTLCTELVHGAGSECALGATVCSLSWLICCGALVVRTRTDCIVKRTLGTGAEEKSVNVCGSAIRTGYNMHILEITIDLDLRHFG